MPRVMALKKGRLLAVPLLTWVPDGHFALPSCSQAGPCRTNIFSLASRDAWGESSVRLLLSFLTSIEHLPMLRSVSSASCSHCDIV